MEKEAIYERIEDLKNTGFISGDGLLALAKEFIQGTFGRQNSFFQQLSQIPYNWPDNTKYEHAKSILTALKKGVELEIVSSISFERRIQIDVVSDYLGQAHDLLQKKEIHPAAAAIIIGASLEEYLRNWCEEIGNNSSKSDGIDSYSKYLKENELLNKQDMKDIIAWAGIRNSAAHGHWDSVKDRERIQLLLESVNYFIRTKMATR